MNLEILSIGEGLLRVGLLIRISLGEETCCKKRNVGVDFKR